MGVCLRFDAAQTRFDWGWTLNSKFQSTSSSAKYVVSTRQNVKNPLNSVRFPGPTENVLVYLLLVIGPILLVAAPPSSKKNSLQP